MAAVTMHHFSGLAAPFVRPKGTVSGGVFTESPHFSQVVANIYGNPILLSLYFSIVLLALLRCFHYAYLKYKYAYEDYLYVLSAQAQAENTETP